MARHRRALKVDMLSVKGFCLEARPLPALAANMRHSEPWVAVALCLLGAFWPSTLDELQNGRTLVVFFEDVRRGRNRAEH